MLIVTDDQTVESVARMPYLSSDPGGSWIRFTNAFANTPVCCPARATLLTGQYAHHTGVISNTSGATLDDRSTIATWLDTAGYETGLFGKYLNLYPDAGQPDTYIPPGWDRWAAFAGDIRYYNYQLNEDGVLQPYGSAPADYSTDVLAAKATEFVSSAAEPFLLYFTPKAPHTPLVPARRHASAYDHFPWTPPPNFNEADVTDKPAWVRSLRPRDASATASDWRTASETLLAVDEAIEELIIALATRGSLDNTVLMFVSDNGFSFGSHRVPEKTAVYDEIVRVPLLIRFPGSVSRIEPRLAAHTDLAPTMAELAGVAPEHAIDGVSLVPLLNGTATDWRTSLLLEWRGSLAMGQHVPRYWAVRTGDWKYVELDTGERELYDLRLDPYELDNRAGEAAYVVIEGSLAAELRRLKGESDRYRAAIVLDSPVSYWRLGDARGSTTAIDEPGRNPGTYSGATRGEPGGLAVDPDTAAGFDGVDDRVRVPDSASLDTADLFTLEAWVRRAATGVRHGIIGKGIDGYGLRFGSSNRLELAKLGSSTITSSTVMVTDTVWHHVVATKNGADVHLYVDGVDVTGTVRNATIANTSAPLLIGTLTGNGPFFNGTIDEVAVYGTALSAERVAEHYRAGTAP